MMIIISSLHKENNCSYIVDINWDILAHTSIDINCKLLLVHKSYHINVKI